MYDYQIFLLDDLPVNEAVTENEDGTFTIFVNSRLCDKKRIEAVQHALMHINNNDFARADVQEIEKIAHN